MLLAYFSAFFRIMEWVELGSELGLRLHFNDVECLRNSFTCVIPPVSLEVKTERQLAMLPRKPEITKSSMLTIFPSRETY